MWVHSLMIYGIVILCVVGTTLALGGKKSTRLLSYPLAMLLGFLVSSEIRRIEGMRGLPAKAEEVLQPGRTYLVTGVDASQPPYWAVIVQDLSDPEFTLHPRFLLLEQALDTSGHMRAVERDGRICLVEN